MHLAIAGRYEKQRMLGKGGFAYCIQVYDLIDKQKYAMKIINKIVEGKPRALEKIENEISILMEMDHPKVCKMIRYFEDDENVYIVQELWEHRSLIDLLKVRQYLTELEVRSYVAQIVEGVEYIHTK